MFTSFEERRRARQTRGMNCTEHVDSLNGSAVKSPVRRESTVTPHRQNRSNNNNNKSNNNNNQKKPPAAAPAPSTLLERTEEGKGATLKTQSGKADWSRPSGARAKKEEQPKTLSILLKSYWHARQELVHHTKKQNPEEHQTYLAIEEGVIQTLQNEMAATLDNLFYTPNNDSNKDSLKEFSMILSCLIAFSVTPSTSTAGVPCACLSAVLLLARHVYSEPEEGRHPVRESYRTLLEEFFLGSSCRGLEALEIAFSNGLRYLSHRKNANEKECARCLLCLETIVDLLSHISVNSPSTTAEVRNGHSFLKLFVAFFSSTSSETDKRSKSSHAEENRDTIGTIKYKLSCLFHYLLSFETQQQQQRQSDDGSLHDYLLSSEVCHALVTYLRSLVGEDRRGYGELVASTDEHKTAVHSATTILKILAIVVSIHETNACGDNESHHHYFSFLYNVEFSFCLYLLFTCPYQCIIDASLVLFSLLMRFDPTEGGPALLQLYFQPSEDPSDHQHKQIAVIPVLVNMLTWGNKDNRNFFIPTQFSSALALRWMLLLSPRETTDRVIKDFIVLSVLLQILLSFDAHHRRDKMYVMLELEVLHCLALSVILSEDENAIILKQVLKRKLSTESLSLLHQNCSVLLLAHVGDSYYGHYPVVEIDLSHVEQGDCEEEKSDSVLVLDTSQKWKTVVEQTVRRLFPPVKYPAPHHKNPVRDLELVAFVPPSSSSTIIGEIPPPYVEPGNTNHQHNDDHHHHTMDTLSPSYCHHSTQSAHFVSLREKCLQSGNESYLSTPPVQAAAGRGTAIYQSTLRQVLSLASHAPQKSAAGRSSSRHTDPSATLEFPKLKNPFLPVTPVRDRRPRWTIDAIKKDYVLIFEIRLPGDPSLDVSVTLEDIASVISAVEGHLRFLFQTLQTTPTARRMERLLVRDLYMNVYPQIHFMLTFVEALLHRERIAHEETARLEQPPMVFSVLSEFLFINSGNIGSVYGALVALTEGHSGLP